jgi:hypothetical protein
VRIGEREKKRNKKEREGKKRKQSIRSRIFLRAKCYIFKNSLSWVCIFIQMRCFINSLYETGHK